MGGPQAHWVVGRDGIGDLLQLLWRGWVGAVGQQSHIGPAAVVIAHNPFKRDNGTHSGRGSLLLGSGKEGF